MKRRPLTSDDVAVCPYPLSPTESDTPTSSGVIFNNDIARVFAKGKRCDQLLLSLDNNEKLNFLSNHWMPDDCFKFPYTMKGGKNPQKVYLNVKHISGKENQCFKYSPFLQGLVCVPCVLFASQTSDNDRKKLTELCQLVNTPLQKYSHLSGSGGYLTNHLGRDYHKKAQEFAENFQQIMKNGTDVRQQISSQYQRHVKEQRERLVPIVKTTILCGRIGIGYRGRRDDGGLDPYAPLAKGDGNFRALLSFRVDSGDKVLEDHLKTTGKNATYISKTTQNELIAICGDMISEDIIRDLKKAKFFSVMADETTDTSHHEQLCLCVRFIHEKDGKHSVREEFLQFHRADDLSGAGLSTQILDALKNHGLELEYLVGQGYDGAAAMSASFNGVQTLIRKQFPQAIYVHCGSHVLNLVLNSTCSVPEIRDMFGVVSTITNFINKSVIRRDIFECVLKEEDVTGCLKTLCATRFIERHDALLRFHKHYYAVIKCLEIIIENYKDRETCDKARSLLKSVTDSCFIIALCCAKKLMALTVGLSRSLQEVNKDLVDAVSAVGFVKDSIKEWRSDDSVWTDERFGPWINSKKLAESAEISITMPRIVGQQRNRNNIPASNPCEYFKRTVWYPYLDTAYASLESRFSEHQLLVLKMCAFIPSECSKFEWEDVEDTVRMYNAVLDYEDVEEVHNEFTQWKVLCGKLEKPPSTALEALDIVPTRFPCIKKLIWIFCTLPVTTCTAERGFSAMKILKNYLRNRMLDERLTGLALMYIHPTTEIPIEKVIDRFSAKKKRRLDFI